MENDNAKLRRYKDDLYVSGFGLIIMGVWSVLKSAILSYLSTKQEYDLTPETLGIDGILDEEKMYLTVFFLALAFILIIAFILHFYVGFNAMRDAKEKKHIRYRASAYIVLICNISLMALYPPAIQSAFANLEYDELLTYGASLIVDLTTIFISASVVVSGRRIAKMKQMIPE